MKVIYAVLFMLCFNVTEAKGSHQEAKYSCQTDEKQRLFCVDSRGKPLNEKVYEYNENGQYSAIVNFKNGYYDGLTTFFDENGRLVERAYYKQGEKNGMDKIYHPNRTIKIQANYKDGFLDGEQEVYFSDGKLAGRFTYRQGKMQKGYCNTYRSNHKNRKAFMPNEMREMEENQMQTCGVE